MDEDGHSELDVKTGLDTISDSSKNLIKFVETYRQLSGVARPVRKAIDLKDLMTGIIALNSEFAASCGATCKYRPEEDDLMIYADEGQISQILINLIKNALPADYAAAQWDHRPAAQRCQSDRLRVEVPVVRRSYHCKNGRDTD